MKSTLHKFAIVAMISAVIFASLTPSMVWAEEPEAIESSEEVAEPEAGEESAESSEEPNEEPAPASEDASEDSEEEPAEAQEEELDGLIDGIADAYQSKDWTLVFAFALMIIIVVVRKLGILDKFVPVKALPWVSLGIGVLWAVGSALVAGQAWVSAIIQVMTVGLSATGLWEALGKSVLAGSSSSEEDAD
jgi:hypothetical protein